jgi:hypothetical protein
MKKIKCTKCGVDITGTDYVNFINIGNLEQYQTYDNNGEVDGYEITPDEANALTEAKLCQDCWQVLNGVN